MKKLLTLLGSVAAVATGASSVVACSTLGNVPQTPTDTSKASLTSATIDKTYQIITVQLKNNDNGSKLAKGLLIDAAYVSVKTDTNQVQKVKNARVSDDAKSIDINLYEPIKLLTNRELKVVITITNDKIENTPVILSLPQQAIATLSNATLSDDRFHITANVNNGTYVKGKYLINKDIHVRVNEQEYEPYSATVDSTGEHIYITLKQSLPSDPEKILRGEIYLSEEKGFMQIPCYFDIPPKHASMSQASLQSDNQSIRIYLTDGDQLEVRGKDLSPNNFKINIVNIDTTLSVSSANVSEDGTYINVSLAEPIKQIFNKSQQGTIQIVNVNGINPEQKISFDISPAPKIKLDHAYLNADKKSITVALINGQYLPSKLIFRNDISISTDLQDTVDKTNIKETKISESGNQMIITLNNPLKSDWSRNWIKTDSQGNQIQTSPLMGRIQVNAVGWDGEYADFQIPLDDISFTSGTATLNNDATVITIGINNGNYIVDWNKNHSEKEKISLIPNNVKISSSALGKTFTDIQNVSVTNSGDKLEIRLNTALPQEFRTDTTATIEIDNVIGFSDIPVMLNVPAAPSPKIAKLIHNDNLKNNELQFAVENGIFVVNNTTFDNADFVFQQEGVKYTVENYEIQRAPAGQIADQVKGVKNCAIIKFTLDKNIKKQLLSETNLSLIANVEGWDKTAYNFMVAAAKAITIVEPTEDNQLLSNAVSDDKKSINIAITNPDDVYDQVLTDSAQFADYIQVSLDGLDGQINSIKINHNIMTIVLVEPTSMSDTATGELTLNKPMKNYWFDNPSQDKIVFYGKDQSKAENRVISAFNYGGIHIASWI